jgi:prepilin-type N-terminal cleavage/methylation domain-containing protein
MLNPRGFTLLEFTVAIIVLGVLVTMAVPNYIIYVNRMKNQEAEHILSILYAEQVKYAGNHSGGYASMIDDLDVSFPDDPKHFDPPTLASPGASINCGGTALRYVASIEVIDGSYTLYALKSGQIVCTPCPSTTCQKMGYTTF